MDSTTGGDDDACAVKDRKDNAISFHECLERTYQRVQQHDGDTQQQTRAVKECAEYFEPLLEETRGKDEMTHLPLVESLLAIVHRESALVNLSRRVRTSVEKVTARHILSRVP